MWCSQGTRVGRRIQSDVLTWNSRFTLPRPGKRWYQIKSKRHRSVSSSKEDPDTFRRIWKLKILLHAYFAWIISLLWEKNHPFCRHCIVSSCFVTEIFHTKVRFFFSIKATNFLSLDHRFLGFSVLFCFSGGGDYVQPPNVREPLKPSWYKFKFSLE